MIFKKDISRIDFLKVAGLMTMGMMLMPRKLFAQDSPVIKIRNEAANAKIIVHPLRGNIHLLEGSGGNIAVFGGKEGILIVDSGIEVSKHKIISAISGIGNKPLKYVVNTHWHFDHTEGNQWMHDKGATIIAHRNTKQNLSETITVKDWKYTFSPVPIEALPTIVFDNEYKMRFNDSEVWLRYYKPSHTNSDISVYFTDADVLHVGDTWWNAHYPFIDHDSGGGIDGMIEASSYNLKLATNKTLIIPGHGSVGYRKDLVKYRDMLVTVRENIAKLKQAGRSIEETLAARPTAAFDSRYGNFVIDGSFFTRLVYRDV